MEAGVSLGQNDLTKSGAERDRHHIIELRYTRALDMDADQDRNFGGKHKSS